VPSQPLVLQIRTLPVELTTTFVPTPLELHNLTVPPPPGRRKRSIDPELVFPGCVSAAAVPDLILFSQMTGQQEYRAVPLPKETALKEILPHSLLVFDPETAARQFDLLGRLRIVDVEP